jgi:hypothetical protein
MASNPKPPEVALGPKGNGSVGPSDIDRPDSPFGLEAEGRAIRILLERFVLLDGEVLNLFGEFSEEFPES